MKIRFTKMHGAGNDFMLIDDRSGQLPWEDHFLMAALASRRTGVGCEGIILIQPSEQADFKMRFLNPDGTEVEMCGNGARCAAAFAHEIGAGGRALTMETRCGRVDAQIMDPQTVRIWMPEPTSRNYGVELKIGRQTIRGDFIRAGVPHFVAQVPHISKVNVMEVGRALRLHPAFAPEGANIDFVAFRPPNRMTMRTYERGLEAESGACGTGAVACVVVAVETSRFTLPTKVKTSSGYELTVDGDWRHNKCTGLTLTGPIRTVFTGEIELTGMDVGCEID